MATASAGVSAIPAVRRAAEERRYVRIAEPEVAVDRAGVERAACRDAGRRRRPPAGAAPATVHRPSRRSGRGRRQPRHGREHWAGPPGGDASCPTRSTIRQHALKIEPASGDRRGQQLRVGRGRTRGERRVDCPSTSRSRWRWRRSRTESPPLPSRCRSRNRTRAPRRPPARCSPGRAPTGRSPRAPATTHCSDSTSTVASGSPIGPTAVARKMTSPCGSSPSSIPQRARRARSADAVRGEIDSRLARDEQHRSVDGHRRIVRAHVGRREMQRAAVERRLSVQSRDPGGAAAESQLGRLRQRDRSLVGSELESDCGHLEREVGLLVAHVNREARHADAIDHAAAAGRCRGCLRIAEGCWCRRRADGRGRGRW